MFELNLKQSLLNLAAYINLHYKNINMYNLGLYKCALIIKWILKVHPNPSKCLYIVENATFLPGYSERYRQH